MTGVQTCALPIWIIDDPNSLSYADGGFVNSLGEDVTVRAYFAELDGLIRLGPKAEEYVDEFDTTSIYGNITGSRVTVDEALQILKKQLSQISEFLNIGKGYDSWKYVEDQDWENEWKKDYKAFKISDGCSRRREGIGPRNRFRNSCHHM